PKGVISQSVSGLLSYLVTPKWYFQRIRMYAWISGDDFDVRSGKRWGCAKYMENSRRENKHLRCHAQRLVLMLMTLTGLFLPVWPAAREIDRSVQGPIGRAWVTRGDNLTNQLFSRLKQFPPFKVKQPRGPWLTRLKNSGFGANYSFEASPLVKDGIMYVI